MLLVVMLVAVVAHLHDVGEDLDEHNVGNFFVL